MFLGKLSRSPNGGGVQQKRPHYPTLQLSYNNYDFVNTLKNHCLHYLQTQVFTLKMCKQFAPFFIAYTLPTIAYN